MPLAAPWETKIGPTPPQVASEHPLGRWTRQALGSVAIGASAVYLWWRVTATLNPDAWWLSLYFLAIELAGFGGFVLFVFTVWRVDGSRRGATVPPPDLRVSVLVTTFDEPAEVLTTTVAAALRIRGIDGTWVLDDGDRPWVREMADHLGAYYLSRTDRSGAKAGNLNNALRVVAADAVLILDADHVAAPDIVEELLPFFGDPAVALVQTPQDFYNLDSFEHARRGQYCEEALFYRVMQPGKDRHNASFWCGTGALVRVDALRDVGGVATGTVTEDLHTTVRLHRAGWATAYYPRVLARGLAAMDGEQFLKQRLRWGRGAMQVMLSEHPLTGAGLTLGQRVSYAATLLDWFESWKVLGLLLLPIAVILSGAAPLHADARVFVPAFVTVLSLQLLTLLHMGRGYVRLVPSMVLEIARLPASLLATLERLRVRGGQPIFTVTSKGLAVGRRTVRPPSLLPVLVGLHLATLPVYVWSELTGRSATPWVLRMAAFWLTVNGCMLTAAVLRIRSGRFATDRRGAVRFPVGLAASVDGQAAKVVELSPGSAQVTSPVALPGTGVIAIELPEGRVDVRYQTVRRDDVDGLEMAAIVFCDGQWDARHRIADAVGAIILSVQPV